MAGQSRQFSSAPRVFGPRCFMSLAPTLQGLTLDMADDLGGIVSILSYGRESPNKQIPASVYFRHNQCIHACYLKSIASYSLTPDVSNFSAVLSLPACRSALAASLIHTSIFHLYMYMKIPCFPPCSFTPIYVCVGMLMCVSVTYVQVHAEDGVRFPAVGVRQQ